VAHRCHIAILSRDIGVKQGAAYQGRSNGREEKYTQKFFREQVGKRKKKTEV
jgi:hypothetical protein